MRLNKYIAQSLGISRRAADALVASGAITVNDLPAQPGMDVTSADTVKEGNRTLPAPADTRTIIILNKPSGYVCSRRQQGSTPTIYDLLPADLQHLVSVGRLDKDSTGLLLLTDDGQLAYELTHPKFQKEKLYEVQLNKPLSPEHRQQLQRGVALDDGLSQLSLLPLATDRDWRVSLHEGRNRQIRRSFAAVGYTVKLLHRTQFGPYQLPPIAFGKYIKIL